MSKLSLNEHDIELLEKECQFTSARAAGPGGQHVNKVETKIILHWPLLDSKILNVEQIDKIKGLHKNKINKENQLVLHEQSARTQRTNKVRALKKLVKIINKSLIPVKSRKATKPTRATLLENKKAKKHRSSIKSLRKKPELPS